MQIEVINYTKKIKQNVVLRNIDYKFESGKIYGVLGHNGSGKTMLLRAICGLIKPSDGKVLLNEQQLFKDFDVLPKTGVIINNQEMVGSMTAYQNLNYLRKINNVVDETAINTVLEEVGLINSANTKVKKFSLGMKQRLNIAQAIFENQEILLLDEPTNAIDSEGIVEILKLFKKLREDGKIVIVATHDIGCFEGVFDEIITLRNGEIIEKN